MIVGFLIPFGNGRGESWKGWSPLGNVCSKRAPAVETLRPPQAPPRGWVFQTSVKYSQI